MRGSFFDYDIVGEGYYLHLFIGLCTTCLRLEVIDEKDDLDEDVTTKCGIAKLKLQHSTDETAVNNRDKRDKRVHLRS